MNKIISHRAFMTTSLVGTGGVALASWISSIVDSLADGPGDAWNENVKQPILPG